MTDIQITKEQLIEAVRGVVRDRGPDYVYGNGVSCYYGNAEEYPRVYFSHPGDEEPSNERCLFGQAFHDLGIPYTEEWEEATGGLGSILLGFGINDPDFIDQAFDVQASQDLARPYGVILNGTVFEEKPA